MSLSSSGLVIIWSENGNYWKWREDHGSMYAIQTLSSIQCKSYALNITVLEIVVQQGLSEKLQGCSDFYFSLSLPKQQVNISVVETCGYCAFSIVS
jgi:hypothetical protein